MPALKRIELWDKLQCQGGATKQGVLHASDLATAKDTRAIDDQESFSFSLTRTDRSGVRAILAQLVARKIAMIVWDDGSFDEWRIAVIEDGHGIAGVVTVTCNPLLLDLAEGADSATGKGLVSTTQDCLRVFNFGVQSLTATQVWDTYVIPNSPNWVSRGTIDPTAVIAQLTWNRLTPQALALQVRDTLRKMNVSCELQLRRNGTTDYKLDLVTQIGATASTTPFFYPRTNLRSLRRRTDTSGQATRLFTTGETDPSGMPGVQGRARWKVTNVDGATKKLTLVDPNGGAGPIGMLNQWVSAYALRVFTGRTFPIQASDPVAQTITLLDVSTFVAGEMIELRLTEPLTNTRTIAVVSPRYAIASVVGNVLTLSSNPITVNSQLVDWYAKVWSAASGGAVVGTPQRISASVAVTDAITVASSAGFNNTQFVEFVQLDGAGEIPSYAEHATAVQAPPIGYGMKAGDLAVASVLGVTQEVPNGWMRAWANPANPPDGWSIFGSGSLAFTRNANPLFTRYGGFSFFADFSGLFLQTARFDHALATGNTRLSARANVFFDTFTAVGGDNTFVLEVWALTADGTSTIGGALGLGAVVPTNYAGATAWTKVPTGAWATIEIVGMDLSLDKAPYGIVCRFSNPTAIVGQCIAYVDTVELYGFVANPSMVYEYGDSTVLHQAGNRQLITNGTPPVSYQLSIADLERSDPATWANNALAVGGNVRAFDPDVGIDATVRLLRRDRNLLSPKDTTVGLSNLQAQLALLVQTT